MTDVAELGGAAGGSATFGLAEDLGRKSGFFKNNFVKSLVLLRKSNTYTYRSGTNVDNDVGGGGMIGLGACGEGIAAVTGGGGIVPTMGDDIIGGTMGITDVVGIAPMVAGDSRLCF